MTWLLWFWRSLSGKAQLIAGGVAIVTLLVGIGGVYAWIDHQGYQRATLEWTVKYEKREAELERQRADELARQKDANDAAIAEMNQQLALYKDELVKATALEEELAKQTAADKQAARIALDAAAVDRYNRSIQK